MVPGARAVGEFLRSERLRGSGAGRDNGQTDRERSWVLLAEKGLVSLVLLVSLWTAR